MKKDARGYYRKHIVVDGKDRYIIGRTKSELAENEKKARRTRQKKEDDVISPTVNEYYEKFSKIRENQVAESTIWAQGNHFKVLSEVIMEKGVSFGKLRIKDITGSKVEKLRQKLLEAGKSPENLNICFAHLKTMFNYAVLDDTIDKNPCRALRPLKGKKPSVSETIHRALTLEETKRFFEEAQKAGSFYLNLYKLMVKTGLRIGEATALYPEDIDTEKGFIHINKTIVKNQIGGFEIGNTTKTKTGMRDIPLTDELKKITENQMKVNRETFRSEGRGLLFQSSDGGILREYTVNRDIKKICQAAGIDIFTTHCFRNTFATRFIEQSPQDYKILSVLLGHKDVSITLNLYTHVMTENLVKAFKNIQVKVN